MTHAKNARYSPSGFTIAICQEIAALICRVWLTAWGGYTVRVDLPKLDKNKRYIIAPNHQSMMDPFAVFALLPFRQRAWLLPLKFMIIPKIFHKWWVKPFAISLGCFPAHVRDKDYAVYGVEGSIAMLRQGYSLCIFPEGTRTLRVESDPKPGVSRILAAYPEATLLIAHLQWRVSRWRWRRHLTMIVAEAPQTLDKSNPKAIMEAIYEL